MDLFVRASSAWKKALGGIGGTGTAVRVSSAWKSIEAMWVREGGAWKQFFAALTLKLTSVTVINANTTNGGFALFRNGELSSGSGNSAGWTVRSDEWVDAGRTATVGDDFEARLTKTSGDDNTAGQPLGTWLTISELRQWNWSTSGGAKVFEGTLEIRDIATSGSDYSVSATVTINVDSL